MSDRIRKALVYLSFPVILAWGWFNYPRQEQIVIEEPEAGNSRKDHRRLGSPEKHKKATGIGRKRVELQREETHRRNAAREYRIVQVLPGLRIAQEQQQVQQGEGRRKTSDTWLSLESPRPSG